MELNKGASIVLLVLATLFIFMGAQYLNAEEVHNSDEITKEISNNISFEYVTCAAYFFFHLKLLDTQGILKLQKNMRDIVILQWNSPLSLLWRTGLKKWRKK